MSVDDTFATKQGRHLAMTVGAGAAVALVVSLLVQWISTLQQPEWDAAELEERLTHLEQSAQRLENDIVAMQESASGYAAQAGQLIAMQGRISELNGVSDALAQSVSGKATREDLGRLRETLAELEQQTTVHAERFATTETSLRDLDQTLVSIGAEVEVLAEALTAARQSYQQEISTLRGAQAKAAAAALITRDIEAAIEEGREFAATLERLTRVLNGDEQLVEMTIALRPLVAGVASLDQLIDDLNRIRREVATRGEGDDVSWVGQTVENLRALVDIEGVPASLASFDQAIKAARAATIEGDLATADSLLEPHIAEHERLPRWLDASRERQAAIAAIGEISHYLDDLLSRQG